MFKTVDGELKVFNKTILSTQNNLKNLQTQTANLSYYTSGGSHVNLQNVPIAQPQTVSNFTKLNNAFKVYNGNLTKSTGLQNAYIKSVGTQNQALGNYLAGLKGAPATFGGYIAALTKAKLATIGLHAASIALNMALTMGISFAIQGLITLFDNLIHRSEKIQEAANNARSAIDDVKSSLDNLKTTTNDVKKRYAELAQEVNNLGKINQSQGSLSTDEYAEFLNLSNQLADLFPQLTRGYDDNGNAILSLSGNVGTIVGSLNDLVDVQQRLANLQILENMPDVWNGYINKVYDDGKINRSEYRDAIKQNKAEQDAILKMMSDLETGTTSSYNSLDSEFGAIGVEMYNAIDAALKQFNLGAPGLFRKEFTGIVGEELTHWDFSSLTREQMSAVKNALGTLADEYQKEIELTTGKLKTANAEMSGYINTWLSTEWNFNRLAPEMQNVVKDVLLNSDWISMLPDSVDASNWDEVSAWLQNNFLYAVNDIDSQQIKTALVDVFNGEFTVESLQGIIDQLIKTEGFDENNPLIIYLKTKMEGREEYEKNYDAAVNKYGAEGKAEIEKAFKKNSIDTQEELDNWIEVTKGAKDAAEAVDMYAESKKNANNPISIGDLEGASDKIKTLGSAFKELSEDGYITTKTLGEIQTATGLSGDEWEDYKTKLLNAKVGSAEFNQIMSDMTVKILDNAFAGRDLTSVTEDEIEAILRENGVVNASAVAKEYKARATLQAKLAEADYSNGIDAVVSALGSECKALGLTEQEVKDLATMYASAQQAMLDAVETGASARLNILKSELEGITGIAEAYALLGRGYDVDGDGVNDYSAEEMDDMSAEDLKKYRADSAKIIAYGNAVEALKKIQEIDIDVPNYSGNTKDSGSDNTPDYEDPTDAIINRINLRADELAQQEEEIQNLIEIAELENDYKKQISLTNDLIDARKQRVGELNKANAGLHNEAEWLRNSTPQWNEEEWFDSQGNATKTYIDFINGRIKDGADKEEIESIKNQFESISKYKKAWVDNDKELVELNKQLLQDAEKLNDLYASEHENKIRDIEHSRDMALESNPFADTTSYYKQMQEAYHTEAERLRALDPEKYAEEIQELQMAWHDAQNAIVDWRWENSQNWINQRNAYNDWELFGDSEMQAWERVVKWLNEEYPNELDKIREAEQSLFEARKAELSKATDFASSYLDSQKTLLQSYYDVRNTVSDAQHEINKELVASLTMSEYLDERTKDLLFNQEDYNILSEELYDIQYKADKLRRQYERDLENSTLNTIEEITSNYEMQYEMLMKSYEIAKADLEIAKKKQKLNNVLNERNVRMFINGQWQWVADTQDVIDAQSELADAEYARKTAIAGERQTESLNDLTKQQDELGTVINKFEDGVITLDEAMDDVADIFRRLPDYVEDAFAKIQGVSSNTSKSSSSKTSYSYNGVSYDPDFDYHAAMNKVPVASKEWNELNRKRNAKILGEGLDPSMMFASGTKYTPAGDILMGEKKPETFINANGHLIPINQPTFGNFGAGGIVFNQDQMANLRSLWDLSNIGKFNHNGIIGQNVPKQTIDNSNCNNVIINGMTVDSGSSDGQALINALRRYVGNH